MQFASGGTSEAGSLCLAHASSLPTACGVLAPPSRQPQVWVAGRPQASNGQSINMPATRPVLQMSLSPAVQSATVPPEQPKAAIGPRVVQAAAARAVSPAPTLAAQSQQDKQHAASARDILRDLSPAVAASRANGQSMAVPKQSRIAWAHGTAVRAVTPTRAGPAMVPTRSVPLQAAAASREDGKPCSQQQEQTVVPAKTLPPSFGWQAPSDKSSSQESEAGLDRRVIYRRAEVSRVKKPGDKEESPGQSAVQQQPPPELTSKRSTPQLPKEATFGSGGGHTPSKGESPRHTFSSSPSRAPRERQHGETRGEKSERTLPEAAPGAKECDSEGVRFADAGEGGENIEPHRTASSRTSQRPPSARGQRVRTPLQSRSTTGTTPRSSGRDLPAGFKGTTMGGALRPWQQQPQQQPPPPQPQPCLADNSPLSPPRMRPTVSSTSPRTAPGLPVDQTLQQRLGVAMIAMENGLAPGASDKWKALQHFHESMPKHQARVDNIERVATPEAFARFCENESQYANDAADLAIGFYAPKSTANLDSIRESGLSVDDFDEVSRLGFGLPVGSQAMVAHHQLVSSRKARRGADSDGHGHTQAAATSSHCLCLVLCKPRVLGAGIEADVASSSSEEGKSSNNAATSSCPGAGSGKLHCVKDPGRILIAYMLWYAEVETSPFGLRQLDDPRPGKKQTHMKQQREYARVRDALIKVALQGLEQLPANTMTTTLLNSTSLEAESVIELYLLGGGASRTKPKAPGIDPREALGSVVVQRIENAPLFREYLEQGCLPEDRWDRHHGGSSPSRGSAGGPQQSTNGALRFREDVVWHGTRLKRMDGEGTSLASKLQSIAENGFDPQRCEKGTHAEGGIWVAMGPLASFGSGCDGLVAFVLCLAKTHFNEWMDSSCARVLRRERVLPLYSLVHA